MTVSINYPDSLPLPIRNGYQVNHVSPMMRTELDTGRARQRRRYTSVPSIVSVSWIMNSQQAQVFEAWFRYTLFDGSEWFNAELRTPLGLESYECRFAEMYSGPVLVGKLLWQFTAELELSERQTLLSGWEDFPEFVLGSDIIDLAMNQEWPPA